jgi:Glycosyl-hydrolase 97 N-terminal/Glycoside hydrolase 97/Glycosyl-hydrolase 97 C-terminal, oligomerisation
MFPKSSARFLMIFFGFLAAYSLSEAAPVMVASPNNQVRFNADVNPAGHLVYTVSFKGSTVIEESPLGITVEGVDLGAAVTLGPVTRSTVNETYPWRGVKSVAVNHFKGAILEVTGASQKLFLEVRVFNDGIAFRYRVPGTGARTISGEATRFTLPLHSQVWWCPMMIPEARYETLYSKTDISSLPEGTTPACVMTVELPGGGYAAFTEANLVDCPGMYYLYTGNRVFQCNFIEPSWTLNDTITSPFRVIMLGSDLNALVNCDIVHNVCPPPSPELANADWIKSGMAVWNWVQHKSVSVTNMQQYSKAAGALGFPYNTVDAGWSHWTNEWETLKQLADYSKPFNVKLFAWVRWTEIDTHEERKAYFEELNKAGVVGIKVDGIDNEMMSTVNWYIDTLKDAADYKIMVLFHGCNKPTGLERTWPNEVGREAIRGMENQPPWSPCNTTLPFTRCLAGHSDFTPLIFNYPKRTGETSQTHQIGTAISYTTSFQNLAGDPRYILANPAVDIIKSIPTDWDETVVLPMSKIGDLLGFARRKDRTWFVTLLNGDPVQAKIVPLKLSFLGSGRYKAEVVKDDRDNMNAIIQESSTVTSSDFYTVEMRGGGGWVGRFTGKD